MKSTSIAAEGEAEAASELSMVEGREVLVEMQDCGTESWRPIVDEGADPEATID